MVILRDFTPQRELINQFVEGLPDHHLLIPFQCFPCAVALQAGFKLLAVGSIQCQEFCEHGPRLSRHALGIEFAGKTLKILNHGFLAENSESFAVFVKHGADFSGNFVGGKPR